MATYDDSAIDGVDQSIGTAADPSTRLRMSLFDMNPSFAPSQKWEMGSLTGVNFDGALLDKLRDARIDDYCLVHTIGFGGADGANNPSPPVWQSFSPLGSAQLRVLYLQGLGTELHNRNVQLVVGYEAVDSGTQQTHVPFVNWLAAASTAQVQQHANDIVAFFSGQNIPIDGIGFDFELNGFGMQHAANLATLFSTIAAALPGGIVYYDTAAFAPTDGAGSTAGMAPQSYALANGAANLVARPMCYNGVVLGKPRIAASVAVGLGVASPAGSGAHIQMAIDVSRTSDADIIDMCTNVFRAKSVGMTIYTMPNGGSAAQTALLTRAQQWEAALNPGSPAPGTSGQPLQAPRP